MVDWSVLAKIDWTAVSSTATAAALLVSAAVFRVQLADRRRIRRSEDRAQAEQVSGWLTVDRETGQWTAHLRNASTQPVYDMLYVVHDGYEGDAAFPEFIPVVPPETTWSWWPTFIGDPRDVEDDPLLTVNARPYMTFRDGRSLSWQRDVHGRISPTRRPVDWAPRPSRVTGRIFWYGDEGRGWYPRHWWPRSRLRTPTPLAWDGTRINPAEGSPRADNVRKEGSEPDNS